MVTTRVHMNKYNVPICIWSDKPERRKTMKKADLENGMVVETRNGGRYLFINSTFVRHEGFLFFNQYNEDLTSACEEGLDIMRVFDPPAYKIFDVLDVRRNDPDAVWEVMGDDPDAIWEREDAIEVTMAEIEEKFGCKVKVVKE